MLAQVFLFSRDGSCVKGDTMQMITMTLSQLPEMMYPNPAVEELKAIADKMCFSERLVDMNQVMEITTPESSYTAKP